MLSIFIPEKSKKNIHYNSQGIITASLSLIIIYYPKFLLLYDICNLNVFPRQPKSNSLHAWPKESKRNISLLFNCRRSIPIQFIVLYCICEILGLKVDWIFRLPCSLMIRLHNLESLSCWIEKQILNTDCGPLKFAKFYRCGEWSMQNRY